MHRSARKAAQTGDFERYAKRELSAVIPDNLMLHAFSTAVWKEAAPLQKQAEDQGLDDDQEQLDEYQFYVMRVGYSLAQLVTWIEQLDHAVFYLSNFSYNKKAQSEGINRAKHLLYNIENYLIRLHSVYDRALQLTNNVFHLGVEESNVGHSVIVSNLKVARTEVKGLLKALKKEAEKKAQERHAIVHRESHREDSLRRLEMFYMFDKDSWGEKDGALSFEGLAHLRSQLLKTVVAEKKQEFSELNKNIFEKVDALLVELHQQYNKERQRLRGYVYGSNAYTTASIPTAYPSAALQSNPRLKRNVVHKKEAQNEIPSD